MPREFVDIHWASAKLTFRRGDYEAIFGLAIQVRLKLERHVNKVLSQFGCQAFPKLGELRRVWEDCYWTYVRLQSTTLHLQRWRT